MIYVHVHFSLGGGCSRRGHCRPGSADGLMFCTRLGGEEAACQTPQPPLATAASQQQAHHDGRVRYPRRRDPLLVTAGAAAARVNPWTRCRWPRRSFVPAGLDDRPARGYWRTLGAAPPPPSRTAAPRAPAGGVAKCRQREEQLLKWKRFDDVNSCGRLTSVCTCPVDGLFVHPQRLRTYSTDESIRAARKQIN